MTAIISLLVLCALIILNGFFTMSETALIACRRARLQPSADDGDGVAKKILCMMDNPTAALSTIQIGITIIGLVSGMIARRRSPARSARRLNTSECLPRWQPALPSSSP